MTRMRSPSYPSISLAQAIDLISKIHKANRTNVIDRESAAKDMGYSGLTGHSLKLLAALLQFNLLAKTGKGDVKVTQTAVDILHAIDEDDRSSAKMRAGLAPSLFKEIHDRFPDGIPSENAIRSYLIQQGFADVAIGPAISAFSNTNHYLKDVRVSKSHGSEDDDAQESEASTQTKDESMTPQTAPQVAPPPQPVVQAALNQINMNIQGDRVHVDATLDYRGLLALEKKIAGLKLLMAMADADSADETQPN